MREKTKFLFDILFFYHICKINLRKMFQMLVQNSNRNECVCRKELS